LDNYLPAQVKVIKDFDISDTKAISDWQLFQSFEIQLFLIIELCEVSIVDIQLAFDDGELGL